MSKMTNEAEERARIERTIAEEVCEAWTKQCKEGHAEGRVSWWTSAKPDEVLRSNSPWLAPIILKLLIDARFELAARAASSVSAPTPELRSRIALKIGQGRGILLSNDELQQVYNLYSLPSPAAKVLSVPSNQTMCSADIGTVSAISVAPVSAEKCPDCAANDRDWKVLADELGVESTRESMVKKIRELLAAPSVASEDSATKSYSAEERRVHDKF